MAEVAVAMLVVSVMLVAALNTVGAARLSQSRTADRLRATLLAEDLMTEILQQAYREEGEPDLGALPWLTPRVRVTMNDVDDYDGWTSTPPCYRDGSPIPDAAGWTRAVEVVCVDPDDFMTVSVLDTGVKRITVTVSYEGRRLVEVVSIRTEQWGVIE